MSKKSIQVVVVFLLCAGILQNNVKAEEIITIEKITFHIEGRTREWALERFLLVEEGQVFKNKEALVEFLDKKQQVLQNQRIFQDARIEHVVSGNSVKVDIYTKDTWNFIALPYGRYDSNRGLLLSLRVRDYNFLGTMQGFDIDIDYERTNKNKNQYFIGVRFDLPFIFLQEKWSVAYSQEAKIEEDGDLDLTNAISLSYFFYWLNQEWITTYTESFRYITNDKENDIYFFTSRGQFGTSIDTKVTLPLYENLFYTPAFYLEGSYKPERISRSRRGLRFGLIHSLTAGSFNWLGNYRDGKTISLSNDNVLKFINYDWDNDLRIQTSVYKALGSPDENIWHKLGLSGRISAFWVINTATAKSKLTTVDDEENKQDRAERDIKIEKNAAKDIRGILDSSMEGDLGTFLNLDFTFSFWTWKPIWEMQMSIFFDTAFVYELSSDINWKENLRFGSGIEIITFPLFARSLYVRGSIGFDVRKILSGKSLLDGEVREIFIGVGHHY